MTSKTGRKSSVIPAKGSPEPVEGPESPCSFGGDRLAKVPGSVGMVYKVLTLNLRHPRISAIDHLLLNPVAAKRLKGAGVDKEVRGVTGASDHAPAWVELKDG
jgi:endonuclease/exonuclease/phosphatase family metal-dependent hydrolase